MQRFLSIALLVALATSCACGQQVNPAQPPAPANPQPERVKVYSSGAGVTAPKLLPLQMDKVIRGQCKSRQEGEIELSLLVDTTGQPRDIMFVHPFGTNLDRVALLAVEADLFTPGTLDGKPVVVAVSLDMHVQSCIEETLDSAGKPATLWRLRTVPRQSLGKMQNPPTEAVLTQGPPSRRELSRTSWRPDYFGAGGSAPMLISSAEAQYTPAAAKARIKGACLVSLVVDPHGLPENVKVLRHLDPGLDQSAFIAVSNYRYFPAIKDDEPVPAAITVEVRFDPESLYLEN